MKTRKRKSPKPRTDPKARDDQELLKRVKNEKIIEMGQPVQGSVPAERPQRSGIPIGSDPRE